MVHRRTIGNKFFNLSNDIDPYDALSSVSGAPAASVVPSRRSIRPRAFVSISTSTGLFRDAVHDSCV